MDRDRTKGRVKEIEGRAMRRVGKLTGSKKTQLKGALRETQGTLQRKLGEAQDSVRRARADARPPRGKKTVKVRTTTRTTTIRT